MNSHNNYSYRRRAKHTFPRGTTYKDVFRIKPIPLNWFRGVGSAISVGTPALFGFLIGNPGLGILASIGGFTFLYVSNETYAQRAARLFWIAIGLTASFALGALCSSNTFLMVLMFGVVGGLSTLMFNLFRMIGPGAMFFVLTYAVGTSMAANLDVIMQNTFILFLGGLFAWIVGMAGVIINPHRTESRASSAVYHSLANLLSAIGTEHFTDLQHQTASLMQQADQTLVNSKFFRAKDRQVTEKLRSLNTQARDIFLSILDVSLMPKHEVEEQLCEALQIIANQIQGKDKKLDFTVQPLNDEEFNQSLRNLYLNIEIAFEMNTMTILSSKSNPEELKTKVGFQLLLKNVFKSGSNAPFVALRYGIVLLISAAIAYGFHFDRSYWLPLSSAAVMGGGTYVSNLHRGIQRAVGTIIGIMVGAVILWLHPQGIAVPFILASLQFIVELIYGRNYSLAVIFITPSTLLIGSTLQPTLTSEYFISARIVDIIIGSLVAIIGTSLLWRKTASKRLPLIFRDTVEQEGALLAAILNQENKEFKKSIEEKLQDSLIQLRLVYDNAFAESMRRNARTTILWPAIGDSLHLGYMLLAASRNTNIHPVSKDRTEKYEQFFAVLAESIKNNKKPIIDVPALPEFPTIFEDLIQLKRSLRVLDLSLNYTK